MIPELTHLQYLVLTILMGSEQSGRHVREELEERYGHKRSLASFYQLMSRLEDAGMVKGCYERKTVEGHTVKERRYEVLGHGIRAWERSRDFYANAAALRDPGLATELG
ncbi:MAG: hypothetical protein ACYSWU_14435 [Planctomycetota bacterium]